MPLSGISRNEFLARVGLLREVEPMTEQAYQFVQETERQKPNKGAAVDSLWHLSFHGSVFPGDRPNPCGRQALYSLMDIPKPPVSRWLQQVADAGKDIEDRLVMTWYLSGQLVSPPPYDYAGRKQKQLQFQDPDVWLTSTVDAITCHVTSDQAVVVEVKSKFAHDLEDMRNLARGADEAHIYQLKCQIGLAHEHGDWKVQRCINTGRLAVKIGLRNNKVIEVCPQHGHDKCLRVEVIKAPDYGIIYYVSRDSPSDTYEYFYEYDPEFMQRGRERLAKWKQDWIDGTLPQTDFSDKRFSHPFGWQWTKPEYPCHWCKFGDICREDHREAVKRGTNIKLQDSVGIYNAKEVREDYDFDLIRAAVQKRWIGTNEKNILDAA